MQGEFAAAAGLALEGDPSAVGFDDVLHEAETDADPGSLAAELGSTPIERLEDLLVFGGRDAFAGIADPDA